MVEKNVSEQGLFITLEGIEGSGKTTQIKILEDLFAMRKIKYISTREPGGTRIGDAIRNILLNPDHQAMVPTTELLLYAASRAQHVAEVIQPALDAGMVVLCDRFYDATFAYQGAARGQSTKLIADLNNLATNGLKPRLTFVLDCPAEVGLRRARERFFEKNGTQGGDRIEAEDLAFHERVRDYYLAVAKAEPQRVMVIDANDNIHAIREVLIREVERLL